MEQMIKAFDAEFDVDEGKREVISIISTKSIDRDGDVLFPSGLLKKNYAGNPVVLVNHDRTSLPVGKALWIKKDGKKVIAKSKISDKTQMARDVFGLIQDEILSATSVGFIPLKFGPPSPQEVGKNPNYASVRYLIKQWELLEYSFVTIPANSEAITLAVSKGYSPETVKFLNGGDLPETKQLIKNNCWCWEQPEIPMPAFSKQW